MKVLVETLAELIGGFVQHPELDAQHQDMRHVEHRDHADNGQHNLIQSCAVRLAERQIDGLLEQPGDRQFGRRDDDGNGKQGDSEILAVGNVGPQKTYPLHVRFSSS